MNNSQMAEEALKQFLDAVDHDLIETQPGDVHHDICFHFDKPMGELRFTYGLYDEGIIKSVVVITNSDSYKATMCFDVGYATLPKYQNSGLAKRAVSKAIDEIQNGFVRNGVEKFYLEMKVDKSNAASNSVANHFSTESHQEPSVNRYFKLVEKEE